MPLLGKNDIGKRGPRTAGRHFCAVNSEPPEAAENFRRADSLRPSAGQMKSGGAPLRGAEPKKEGILSFDKIPSFLVRLKGFEPPTYWFVASHSIQLSYSRILPNPYLS